MTVNKHQRADHLRLSLNNVTSPLTQDAARQPKRSRVRRVHLRGRLLSVAGLSLMLFVALAHLPISAQELPPLATNTPHPTSSPTPLPAPYTGGLAFTSERDGLRKLYLIQPDGDGLRRLTNLSPEIEEAYPAFSPDGTQVVFQAREIGGRWQIAAADVTTGTAQMLTDNAGENWRPAFSPDGTRIVFQSNRDGNWELYLLSTTGGDLRRLTDTRADEWDAAWSPDGTQLAYRVRELGGVWQLHLLDLQTFTTRALTAFESDAGAFAWSPDGRKIAVERAADILTLDLAGGTARNITASSAYDARPAWSPTGDQLTYAADWEIVVANADGSAARNLTTQPDYDDAPAWSPDGTRIAFQSYRDGNWEIYVMDADSCNLRRLTDARARDVAPVWQPSENVRLVDRGATAIVSGTDSVVLRAGPGTQFAALGGAHARDCLPIVARTAAGDWLQVQTPDGSHAWITAQFAEIIGDLSRVPVFGG